jgi:hypothetical protein
MNLNRPSTFIILLGFLISCDSDDYITGPCEHVVEDPVIHINRVTDAGGGVFLREFKITSALMDSIPVDALFLKGPVAYNSVVFNGELICNPPCGFGATEGTYVLHVSAPNYRDTSIVICASYANFKGGCPSSNSDGTLFNFEMQRQ